MFYDGDCGDVLACRGAIPYLARYLSAMEDNIIKSTKDFAVCSVCLVGTGSRKKKRYAQRRTKASNGLHKAARGSLLTEGAQCGNVKHDRNLNNTSFYPGKWEGLA